MSLPTARRLRRSEPFTLFFNSLVSHRTFRAVGSLYYKKEALCYHCFPPPSPPPLIQMAVSLVRGPARIPLTIRVENAALSEEERGLRIQAWSSVSRFDAGRLSQADVGNLDAARRGPGDPEAGALGTQPLTLLFPTSNGEGTERNPWPADAYVWFGAQIFAPSADGPLVGSRGGAAAISMRDLRDRVVAGGSSVVLKIVMQQAGLKAPLRKMNLRILSVDGPAFETVRRWVFATKIEQEDFVGSLMQHHDQMLENYVRKLMFPFTDEAVARGLGFRATTRDISALHAPLWDSNVPVPQWAFWMQIGDRIEGDQMRQLAQSLRSAFDIVLARHDWKGGERDFIALVLSQTRNLDSDAYDPRYTFACAVLCDVCALFATQLYYRYDEAFEVEEHWFKSSSTRRYDIESFHDALAMHGGDCEDLASLIHRVFRWIQMGDPSRTPSSINSKNFFQTYGGWTDPALDALQRMAYWYVSGGCVGSVTSARVPSGAGGKKPKLIINSDLDESLSIGGHMWNVMLPVTKAEELLKRMNRFTIGPGDLRPDYPGRRGYPGWIRYLPMLTGEGTGALYPLVMPWKTYMHTDQGRELAELEHTRRLDAVELVQNSTRAMRLLQVQRVSDRVDPEANQRVNFFYRRATAFYTDDMALRGIPHFGCVWTRTAPRVPETTAPSRVAGIPGEGGPGTSPTWGVNLRDVILAANGGAYGDGKPNVALTLNPAVTDGEMASFKSRIRQLKPWAVPVITESARDEVERLVGGHILAFQQDLDDVLGTPEDDGEEEDGTATRINIVFRRDEFTFEKLRRAIIRDARSLAPHIVKATTTLEYPFDDGYSVCLALWIKKADA